MSKRKGLPPAKPETLSLAEALRVIGTLPLLNEHRRWAYSDEG